MVDYRKYIQVLDILKDEKTNTHENMASAICELFDVDEYENAEYDMSPNDFQSCWCPKWVTCPWY